MKPRGFKRRETGCKLLAGGTPFPPAFRAYKKGARKRRSVEVTYINNGKNAYFQGKRYTRDDQRGYYKRIEKGHPRYLHRRIYEAHNGAIPEGYHIHHLDGDKSNNEISNLVILQGREHEHLHWEAKTEKQVQWYRNNLIEKAQPAAIAWHKSDAGREWHKVHYKATKERLHERGEFVCMQCGKVFTAHKSRSNKFCSNNCKSTYRRRNGADNVAKVCVVCGKEFYGNKYSTTKCCGFECGRKLRLISLRQNKANQAASRAAGL